MQSNSYTHFGAPTGMTYGVQLLLIANIAAAVIDWFAFPISQFLSLSSHWWSHAGLWELVTYQFLHQNLNHLLFNMLALFFIGPEVERGLGTNRFFALYLLSGILGGLGWSILAPFGHCVGASGAVFGVLGAFAAMYPNQVLYIWGLIPVKAWLLVLILGTYELMHVLSGPGGTVANAAHLGGGLAGYAYALAIDRPHLLRALRNRWQARARADASKAEIDRILDKAARHGIHSLSAAERAALKRAGRS